MSILSATAAAMFPFIIIIAATPQQLDDSYFLKIFKQLTEEQSSIDVEPPVLTPSTTIEQKPQYDYVPYSFDSIMDDLNKTMDDFWGNDTEEIDFMNKTSEEIAFNELFVLVEENEFENVNDTEINFSDTWMNVSDTKFDLKMNFNEDEDDDDDDDYVNDNLSDISFDDYFDMEQEQEVNFCNKLQISWCFYVLLFLMNMQACFVKCVQI